MEKAGVNVKSLSFQSSRRQRKTWISEDIIGTKNLGVYFYPAAMTGGCTQQACTYRDEYENLSSVDAEVVGISGDKVENLELFKRANNTLWTDTK